MKISIERYRISDVDFSNPIFRSMSQDYPSFNSWCRKIVNEPDTRHAWVASNSSQQMLAVAITKLGEGVLGESDRSAKLSTFKVSTRATDQGLADQLLSSVLLFLVEKNIENLYVTVFPKHEALLSYFVRRGFRAIETKTDLGEIILTLSLHTKARITSIINKIAYEVLAMEYVLRADKPGASQEEPHKLATQFTNDLGGAPRRLLELGPGSGSVLAHLGSDGDQVVAVELSQNMASIAQKVAPLASIVVADIQDVDFPDLHFDGIYMGAFIHLFPKEIALKQLLRVRNWLKPGGKIFVNTTSEAEMSEGFYVKNDYDRKMLRFRSNWTEDGFLELLSKAGFKILSRFETREIERNKHWIGFVCSAKIEAYEQISEVRW